MPKLAATSVGISVITFVVVILWKTKTPAQNKEYKYDYSRIRSLALQT